MANNVIIKRYEFVPFPTGDRWDRPLTDDEWEQLNSREKKTRSYVSLVRKIALLQAAAENPSSFPADLSAPRNRKELREWSSTARGLWSWSYIKLDNPQGVNSDEIAAFFQALFDIDELKKGNQSKLRRQLTEKKVIIERLEARNIQLLEKIGKMHVVMSRAGLRYEDM